MQKQFLKYKTKEDDDEDHEKWLEEEESEDDDDEIDDDETDDEDDWIIGDDDDTEEEEYDDDPICFINGERRRLSSIYPSPEDVELMRFYNAKIAKFTEHGLTSVVDMQKTMTLMHKDIEELKTFCVGLKKDIDRLKNVINVITGDGSKPYSFS